MNRRDDMLDLIHLLERIQKLLVVLIGWIVVSELDSLFHPFDRAVALAVALECLQPENDTKWSPTWVYISHEPESISIAGQESASSIRLSFGFFLLEHGFFPPRWLGIVPVG